MASTPHTWSSLGHRPGPVDSSQLVTLTPQTWTYRSQPLWVYLFRQVNLTCWVSKVLLKTIRLSSVAPPTGCRLVPSRKVKRFCWATSGCCFETSHGVVVVVTPEQARKLWGNFLPSVSLLAACRMLSSGVRREIVSVREDRSPLQPLPLQEAVEEHAVEVVREWRHAQVVMDQSGDKIK